MRILAISGSLRATSSNSALIRAVVVLAPPDVAVHICSRLDQLPYFNPDVDVEPGPQEVRQFRDELHAADALVISSPEYAHGVPGVLKNALDWVVGSGELIGKPIAVINASPRSTYAYNSLVETLTVMSGRIVPEASITVAVSGRLRDEQEISADETVSRALQRAIAALASAVSTTTTS